MTQATEKHFAAIRAGEVSRSNVIGLRKALNSHEREIRGYSISSTAPTMTEGVVTQLHKMLKEYQPRVVGEMVETGKALLRKRRYRRQLGEHALGVIADLDHFRPVGFDYLEPNGMHVTPVYQARDSQGVRFTFRNIPWQSGGNGPEVLPTRDWA